MSSIMSKVHKTRRHDATRLNIQQCPAARTVAPEKGHHSRSRTILGSLSLFSQDPPESDENNDGTPVHQPVICISEDHIRFPASLSDLRHMLADRIQRQCALYPVSEDQWQALAVVMMSELGLIWPDLRGVKSDPLLSQDENKQLRGKVFCEVLWVCEQLHARYIKLLGTMIERGVFSDQANCSRLCAQMAVDCTALLNVRLIRNRVIAGIKAARETRCRPASSSDRHGQQRAPGTHSFTCTQEAKSSSKNIGSERQRKSEIERNFQEITEKTGNLNLGHKYKLLPCYLENVTPQKDRRRTADSRVKGEAQEEDANSSQGLITKLRSYRSMPALHQETLLEELDIGVPSIRAPSPLVLLDTRPVCGQQKPMSAAEDLRRLLTEDISVSEPKLEDPRTDLPSLISVLPWGGSAKPQLSQEPLQTLTQEKNDSMAMKAAEVGPSYPQPAAVSVLLPSKSIARTAAPRVSDRVITESVRLQVQPPVFYDLTVQTEPSSVPWMDRNLRFQAEVKEVYRELSKTISTRHLNFDEDPMIEPAPEDACFKQSPPCKKRSRNLLNPHLKRPRSSNFTHRKEEAPAYEKPQDMNSKAYRIWLQWWKYNLGLDDYLNYISLQEMDYLGVVFHLYDSDDNEEDDEKGKIPSLLLRRRQMIDTLKGKKEEFVTGVWNVNSVLLGGLWKEPPLDEEDLWSSTQEGEVQPGGKSHDTWARGAEHDDSQIRLETIWNALCFPDNQRLDMAIKYSSSSYRDRLEEAITAWENAARHIQQREALLVQLELFEREASDPNRFFQHGYKGTSIARMDESRHRQKLCKQISTLEDVLSKDVQHIWDRFRDTVTYRGRPYKQKMRWDRTEMLYWLQQERREKALDGTRGPQGCTVNRLPPLDQAPTLYCGIHPTPQEQNPPPLDRS